MQGVRTCWGDLNDVYFQSKCGRALCGITRCKCTANGGLQWKQEQQQQPEQEQQQEQAIKRPPSESVCAPLSPSVSL